MGQRCSVCTHSEGHAINVALVSPDRNYRAIADDYGLAQSSVKRHAADHLPSLLTKASEAVESAQADELMVELEGVNEDIYRLRNKAEQRGNLNVALQGCDKALKALELHARVRQIIYDAPQVNVQLS